MQVKKMINIRFCFLKLILNKYQTKIIFPTQLYYSSMDCVNFYVYLKNRFYFFNFICFTYSIILFRACTSRGAGVWCMERF